MNPHYHHQPYPDLNSPHSPSSDGIPSSYHGHTPTGGPPNGHIMGSHHEHIRSHPAYAGGQLNHHGSGPNSLSNYHHHHHYHHFLNNNSNNSNSNSNNSSNQNNVSAVCAGCNTKIMDRYLLKAMDQHWHHRCLKCQVCNRLLAELGSSCFNKDNMILCKNDYFQMYGPKGECSACGIPILGDEMVMRAGAPLTPSPANPRITTPVFHVNCFSCCKCMNRLVSGDRYCMLQNGSLVCEKDWQDLYKTSMPAGQPQTTGPTVRKGKVGRPRRSRD